MGVSNGGRSQGGSSDRKVKRRVSRGAQARADLKRALDIETTALRRIEDRLTKLGPEGAVGKPSTATRLREALRRRRTAQLLKIDRLERRLAQAAPFDPRNAPGFRAGIRSIVSGGAPGLGKRS